MLNGWASNKQGVCIFGSKNDPEEKSQKFSVKLGGG